MNKKVPAAVSSIRGIDIDQYSWYNIGTTTTIGVIYMPKQTGKKVPKKHTKELKEELNKPIPKRKKRPAPKKKK